MKAAVFQGVGAGHRIETVADPEPGPGQVVVKVERSGVCGSEVSLANRTTPSLLGPQLEAMFSPGVILGHEHVGQVVEVGNDIERLRVGDRVSPMFFVGCGRCAECLSGRPTRCPNVGAQMGGYAEYTAVSERFSVLLPGGVPTGLGALVEPLSTSLHTADLAAIRPGDKVVVLGAGTLGLGIVHFARRLGAQRIVVAARSRRHEQAARVLGADGFVTQGPDLIAETAEILDGPPDIVFEAAGAAGLVDQAIMSVRPGGTIVVAGMCLDPESTSHAVAALKELTIRYALAYTVRDFRSVAASLADDDHPLGVLVPEPVSLASFPAAFDALGTSGPHDKVVLDPWRGS